MIIYLISTLCLLFIYIVIYMWSTSNVNNIMAHSFNPKNKMQYSKTVKLHKIFLEMYTD